MLTLVLVNEVDLSCSVLNSWIKTNDAGQYMEVGLIRISCKKPIPIHRESCQLLFICQMRDTSPSDLPVRNRSIAW